MTNIPVERTLLDDETLRDQMAAQLALFAEQLESDLAAVLDRIDLNAALLLGDLCEFLHLSKAQRCEVLGPQASAFVDLLDADRITLPEVWLAVQQLDLACAA
ncbi:MAG TPA: hypothetical protein VII92_03855 [Anaerolineae bacterium]